MLRPTVLRYWPLVAGLLLAWLLPWLQPPREICAGLITLAYLGFCAQCGYRQRPHAVAEPINQGVRVAYASQSGQAQTLAERSATQLREAGTPAHAIGLAHLRPEHLQGRMLLVLSTYGEGEAPDNGVRFERLLQDPHLDLSSLDYAVLALGDRDYQHFCGFGERIDRLLHQRHANRLFDRLDVDKADAGTLRHWQQQLGHLAGGHNFSDWQPAQFSEWQLSHRACLNPTSAAAPLYELTLTAACEQHWRAGDIAEVGPRHPLERVQQWLQALALNPAHILADARRLDEALSHHQLPSEHTALQGLSGEQLLTQLPRLAHREYSIASTPRDGALQLLVRQAYSKDGQLGISSGWLCCYAEQGQNIALRIRANPSFHGPSAHTPLILIGNGSGLAGLRSHLRERALTPGGRNWLLFGERNRAHDFLYQDELQTWQQNGHLERLDLAFSRDHASKRYVQHLLREAADELQQWLASGAAIYVCGSLEGMGREVHQVLLDLLGDPALEQLTEQGRYRRDLY
ncbi:sulfite reductase subunit alpha [Pseudomonas sp. MIL19]|uniref:sulfite reductase subunit alpha n=1 Tax=Pseudomonas sp. MIL19 TaxID=2976979 RepID=UPI0023648348|nr:sulfite reductase subunit alpha [Pseudomonas sp. MIL19]MDD2160414.1 sulfite reductase subunit alpha [Pseudomonas sp. MIL19]